MLNISKLLNDEPGKYQYPVPRSGGAGHGRMRLQPKPLQKTSPPSCLVSQCKYPRSPPTVKDSTDQQSPPRSQSKYSIADAVLKRGMLHTGISNI